MGDAYADLLQRFKVRKSEYLRRITADDAAFRADPVGNSVALRRDYFRGFGSGPQYQPPVACSPADADAASAAAGNYLAVWTDTPCLRTIEGELWDGENIRAAIARLWAYPPPVDHDPTDSWRRSGDATSSASGRGHTRSVGIERSDAITVAQPGQVRTVDLGSSLAPDPMP